MIGGGDLVMWPDRAYDPANEQKRCVMARYLLKRIWGPASDAEMLENALRSKRTRDERFLDITWDHSHVVADDEDRVISYCIYQGPSVERVLDHASATGGHFVDQVLPLTDDLEGTAAHADAVSHRYLVVQRWGDEATRDQIDVALHDLDSRSPDVTREHSHLATDDQAHLVSHGVYRARDDTVVRRHAESMADGEIIELFEIGGDVSPDDLVD